LLSSVNSASSADRRLTEVPPLEVYRKVQKHVVAQAPSIFWNLGPFGSIQNSKSICCTTSITWHNKLTCNFGFWARPRLIFGSIQNSKSIFCTTSILNSLSEVQQSIEESTFKDFPSRAHKGAQGYLAQSQAEAKGAREPKLGRALRDFSFHS
jgi:hypothetical protein